MTEPTSHTHSSHNNPTYYYIPLGYDCSPTFALKSLGLRKCSLPFDWVQSNHAIVMRCMDDDFQHFHKNMYLVKGQVKNGQRLIDHYGVEYPYDYPSSYDVSLNTAEAVADDAAFFPEIAVIDTYKKYRDIVLQKYKMRIERFYEILRDTSRPIIILMRELFRDAMIIKDYLENKFNRKNIIFVVATDETGIVDLPPLMMYFNPCNDEKKDLAQWKQGIDTVKKKYEKQMREYIISNAGSMVDHHHHIDGKHGHWFDMI